MQKRKQVEIINGIKCHHPDAAKRADNYPIDIYQQLVKYELNNFWFTSRNKLIKHLIHKFLSKTSGKSFLEIGSGSGCILQYLKEVTDFNLTGSDIYLAGLNYAKSRVNGVKVIQMDATRFSDPNKYDCVGIFDSLEHIADDNKVISNIYAILKNKGLLILSVPQHESLWSQNDEIAGHKRRYSKKRLVALIQNNNFKVLFCSSLFFLLLPILFITRKLKSSEGKNLSTDKIIQELQISSLFNKLLGIITQLDIFLIRSGVSLPAGGSLFIVAEKN